VTYDAGAPDTYVYDENGNTLARAASAGVTCRVESGSTYNQVYNVENRLSLVQLMNTGVSCPSANTVAPTNDVTASWSFTYDGDGNRVEQVYTDGSGTLTTYYFMDGAYEVRSDGTRLKYYSFGGQTVAMSEGTPGNVTLVYFLTDPLGSVVAVTDSSGALLEQQRYYPFGEVRTDYGTIGLTDYGYTFQRDLDAQGNEFSLGLMDYKARFYDPSLRKFIQPDTIIAGGGSQALNRYAYGFNNPSRFTDPSGHIPCDEEGNCYGRYGKYRAPIQTGNPQTFSGRVEDKSSGDNSIFDPRDDERPEIPVDPTQRRVVDDPPPPVSTTKLVAGTILFGVLLAVGVAITAVGVGVTLEDPFGIGVVAVGLVITAFAVEGLYQTWRPLLPSTWPENLIVQGFKIH